MVVGRADVFGFDPRRMLIGGQSAGGGLSAGTTLLGRDHAKPMPAAIFSTAAISPTKPAGSAALVRSSDVMGLGSAIEVGFCWTRMEAKRTWTSGSAWGDCDGFEWAVTRARQQGTLSHY